jgi:hypothetical protein
VIFDFVPDYVRVYSGGKNAGAFLMYADGTPYAFVLQFCRKAVE